MKKIRRAREVAESEGLENLFRKSWQFGADKFFTLPGIKRAARYLSVKKIEKRKEKEENLNDILNTAFDLGGYGSYNIQPSQVREEISKLAELVKDNHPSTVMEIGTAEGGTFYIWTRYLESASKLISLDLPRGEFGGGYSESHIPFFKKFNKDKKMLFFRKNSHNPQTKQEIKEELNEEKVDFLFIDGDHTYEGVKQDFEMYSPLVSENGTVAFHDIVPGPSNRVGGVPEFWEEIKEDYPNREFVKDWEQGAWGIGVIYK